LTASRTGSTTEVSWDESGNLTAVTPPGKPRHGLTYTPVGLLESYAPPPMGLPVSATSFGYDFDRMQRTELRPDGVQLVMTPDSAGRIDTVAFPGGVLDYDYVASGAASGAGMLSALRGPYGTNLQWTYDGSLTTNTTWSGAVVGSVAWQYNNDFKRVSETVTGVNGSGSTFFGYDDDRLLTCASPVSCSGTSAATALRLTRSPQNGLVTSSAFGSLTEALYYNSYGELARQVSQFGSSPVAEIVYDAVGAERDPLGRITQKIEAMPGGTRAFGYTYDPLGRLTVVVVDGVLSEHFDYDSNGNRIAGYQAGAGTSNGAYDDQDRLLSYGPWAFTYTANGDLETKTNTATGEVWVFHHDALGSLLAVTLPNGDFIEYLVDARGRRVGRKKNGILQKQWLYRGSLSPVAELDGSGAIVAVYGYGSAGGIPAYVQRGGATYRLISDQLGSPRYAINVNNSADVPFSTAYTSFGQASGIGLDWIPFGFAGGIHDADSGLVRFGARDYDPLVGRWVAKDPVRLNGGLNLYAYSRNDPVNIQDATGRDPFRSFGMPSVECPPWICFWNVYDDAVDRAYKEGYGESMHNGRGDAFKHCMASCNMANNFGRGMSSAAGWYNEKRGNFRGQPKEEEDMDNYNNACGRSYSSDEGGEEDCAHACNDAISRGILEFDINSPDYSSEPYSYTRNRLGEGR
jgi:RHS repeat-associated protein